MRAIFGLVGILVVCGVIAAIWAFAYLPYTQQVVKSGNTAQQQAKQTAGIDEMGGRVSQTIVFTPIEMQGKLRYLMVQSMQPNNSYAKYYGIFPGDLIETIGPQNVRDIDDEGMAKALAVEAYQRKWDLVIMRTNKRFTLPRDSAAAAALLPGAAQPPTPVAGTPAGVAAQPAGMQPAQPLQPAQPAQPAPEPADTKVRGNPLYDQLEAIRNAGQ